jgi:hypothetical protein
MPNHITNTIYFEGDLREITQLRKKIRSNEETLQLIDFNKITPMPDNIFQGNFLGEEEQKKYGKNNWYDWSYENWETKWNAYEIQILNFEGQNIQFLTAWSPVVKLMEKLSSMFPRVIIFHYYVDEMWNFVGKVAYMDGKILYIIEPPNTECNEWWEIMARTKMSYHEYAIRLL